MQCCPCSIVFQTHPVSPQARGGAAAARSSPRPAGRTRRSRAKIRSAAGGAEPAMSFLRAGDREIEVLRFFAISLSGFGCAWKKDIGYFARRKQTRDSPNMWMSQGHKLSLARGSLQAATVKAEEDHLMFRSAESCLQEELVQLRKKMLRAELQSTAQSLARTMTPRGGARGTPRK